MTVSIRHVIEAMDLSSPTWESYLDPDSGDIVTVTDEDRFALAHADPQWVCESEDNGLPKVKEALESDHYLMLPDQYEIHEWSIMQRFAQTQRNADIRHELLNALHSRGAYRRFRNALDSYDLIPDWLEYREQALESIARQWLDRYGVDYR